MPVADAAMTLSASMYRDPSVYERERPAIFAREWIVFARAEQLTTPGSCVASVVAGYPIVAVVDREGELRAFHNVCRHRAGPLVDDGEGRASGFVCRYHGWSYDTTGRLINARDFDVVGTDEPLDANSFDPAAFSLFPVRAERWRNLVFVNLDTGAADLLTDLREFFAEAEPFPIESFVFGGDLGHDLECNWKTYVDNYLEGYHIPFVHPELNREIDARRYSVTVGDRYCRHSAPTRDGAVNAGRWLFRWPNLALNLYPNAMVVERMLPTGPHSTRIAYSYFFADPDDPANDDVVRISKTVIEEDRAIVEAVQRNLDAGVYERGRLSPRHEAGVAQFQHLVRTALERPPLERVSVLEPALPRAAYLDATVWESERERIFAREWSVIGRASDAPEPGDWFLGEVGGESLLVVRGDDGALRAFFNVCRHRGAQLCASDGPATGHVPGVLRCPYHSWTYGLDGGLRRTPFIAEADLDHEAFGLHPAGIDEWGGFVFAHLEPTRATALSEQLGPIPERIARYPLAELRRGARITYEVAANWKVLAENYNECYHCGTLHPELCDIVPDFRRGGGSSLDWERGIPQRDGTWTFTATGTSERQPLPGLDADERVRHKGELVYPNLLLSLSADHVAAFVIVPHGPGATTVVCDFLFHPDEIARTSFDPSDAVSFWDVVNRQDWSICESVQRGMSSRAFTGGYFAPMEDQSLDIRRWYEARMGTPRPSD